MNKAVIEFHGYLTVEPDGAEYEGGAMTEREARDWLSTAMARGGKHAEYYTTTAGLVGSVTYEEHVPEE